jgi:hypothetical protein
MINARLLTLIVRDCLNQYEMGYEEQQLFAIDQQLLSGRR